MQSMGDYRGDASVDQAMATVDADANGTVKFGEFKAVMN